MQVSKSRRFVWIVCLVATVLVANEVQGQQRKELAPECPFLLRDVADAANAVFIALVDGSSEEELGQLVADYEASLDTYKMGCTSEGADSENRANSDTTLIIDEAGRFISEVKMKRRNSQMVEHARALQARMKAYLRSHPAKDQSGPGGSRTPEGAIIEGNAVRLMKGYEFVRTGRNRVVLKRSRGNGVSGVFHCTCSNIDGSCEVSIVGDRIICSQGTCTGSCSMTVIVTGVLRKQPGTIQ